MKLGSCLVLLTGLLAACRVLRICDDSEANCGSSTESSDSGAGGDLAENGAAADGTRAPPSSAGARAGDPGADSESTRGGGRSTGGAAGTSSAAGDGQGGLSGGDAGSAASPLDCERPRADCDESRITGCETNLGWNALHCGACGKRCDGACRSQCYPSEDELRDQEVTAFCQVGNSVFVISHGQQATLQRLELQSGQTSVIAQNALEFDYITAASDRLYLSSKYGPTLFSVGLDGQGFEREPFDVETVGASLDGLYFTWQGELWWRPTGQLELQPLKASSPYIVDSNVSGILLATQEPDSSWHLQWLRSGELTSLGNLPQDLLEIRAGNEAAVILARAPGSTSSYALTWISLSGIHTREVSHGASAGPISIWGEYVLVPVEEAGNVRVDGWQDGPVGYFAIGLPPNARFAALSSEYVWYNYRSPATTRVNFKRAHWTSLD